MVTDTRTTIRNEPNRTTTTTTQERTDTANQAALWITLAVLACAGLGYAFYHYSNPANTMPAGMSSSEQAAPVANDNSNVNTQTAPNTPAGTTLNNDTSTAPNTGTNQPTMNNDAATAPSTQQ